MNSHTVILKSVGTARVLLWLLHITLTLTVIKLIRKAIPATFPIIDTLQSLLKLLFIPSLLTDLAILVLSLVWIYRLHNDLRQCYSHYPIDAWDALWSFILVIFSWKTLMTIARHFKVETGRLQHYGVLLHRLVPSMYGIFIARYILDQLIYKLDYLGRVESIRNAPEFFVSAALAVKYILGFSFVFVLIGFTKTIFNAMQVKANQINREQSQQW